MTTSLPFIRSAPGAGLDYWIVPRSGDDEMDIALGLSLGERLIAHLRGQRDYSTMVFVLKAMVEKGVFDAIEDAFVSELARAVIGDEEVLN